MSHRARCRSASLGAWAGSILLLGAGCKQENRDFRETPPGATASEAVRVGELQPRGVQNFDSTITKYDAKADPLGSGQRL
jgi:hypothetical protein